MYIFEITLDLNYCKCLLHIYCERDTGVSRDTKNSKSQNLSSKNQNASWGAKLWTHRTI